MGLYAIDCFLCHKPFLWFSGNLDQRCGDCQKAAGVRADEFLDIVDRAVNQKPLSCGHLPCNLGGCKGCEEHCPKRKKK